MADREAAVALEDVTRAEGATVVAGHSVGRTDGNAVRATGVHGVVVTDATEKAAFAALR